MNKYVSIEEINKLDKQQKENHRTLWNPAKYELIIVPVCKDIEQQIYEHRVYVIQDIIVCDKKNKQYCEISNYQGDISNCGEIIFKTFPVECVRLLDDSDDTCLEFNKKIEADGVVPIQYISKKDCLPLLDISLMIELLCDNKCKSDFSLKYSKEGGVCVLDDNTQYSDSLCASLWEMLKSVL